MKFVQWLIAPKYHKNNKGLMRELQKHFPSSTRMTEPNNLILPPTDAEPQFLT